LLDRVNTPYVTGAKEGNWKKERGREKLKKHWTQKEKK